MASWWDWIFGPSQPPARPAGRATPPQPAPDDGGVATIASVAATGMAASHCADAGSHASFGDGGASCGSH
jgi:hypothetical protein